MYENLEGMSLKSIQMKLTIIILVIFIGALGTLAGLNYWKARQIITQNVTTEMEKLAVNSACYFQTEESTSLRIVW